jgi:glutamate-5-semialdehyde dehydrogenase
MSENATEIDAKVRAIAQRAHKASLCAMSLSTDDRNRILKALAESLVDNKVEIQQANQKDLEFGRTSGLSEALIDRLDLNDSRFDAMVQGLEDLIAFEDPLGKEISSWTRPNGLSIARVRAPIGVIGMIYESRPNVTADAAGLCVKTANSVILRGGREAIHTNRAIADALVKGGLGAGMPEGMIELIDFTDREGVKALVQLDDLVDLIVPRGGEGLIRAVADMSKVPVLKHYKGVCHTYVDKSANLVMAKEISINAKVQRPGVCNAMETLLVHRDIAESFLPRVCKGLQELGVELRGDEATRELVDSVSPADESDWEAEYLSMILAIKVVSDIDAAIEHINKYGSRHTDAIVAESVEAQEEFVTKVDSGVLMVNASTRFNDGAEFGLGAEIGISTDKLHARGPVGAEGLTTYKYIVRGQGQIKG